MDLRDIRFPSIRAPAAKLSDVSGLLECYVRLHNECVRRRDFSSLLALFAPDAVMRFDGIAAGPFSGASAIAQAFR